MPNDNDNQAENTGQSITSFGHKQYVKGQLDELYRLLDDEDTTEEMCGQLEARIEYIKDLESIP